MTSSSCTSAVGRVTLVEATKAQNPQSSSTHPPVIHWCEFSSERNIRKKKTVPVRYYKSHGADSPPALHTYHIRE